MYVMEYGASAEIAVVGNEGFLGIPLFMGGETTPSRAVVQSAGYGYRLKAALLKQDIAMTQELIANMLGVRREGVTDAAGKQHAWRSELSDVILARQQPDGSWVNENPRWMEGDPNLVTSYALLALSYCTK